MFPNIFLSSYCGEFRCFPLHLSILLLSVMVPYVIPFMPAFYNTKILISSLICYHYVLMSLGSVLLFALDYSQNIPSGKLKRFVVSSSVRRASKALSLGSPYTKHYF